jgi:hypothetical protein
MNLIAHVSDARFVGQAPKNLQLLVVFFAQPVNYLFFIHE